METEVDATSHDCLQWTPPKAGPTLPRPVAAVDLFCGAGGLTRGLLDAGIDVVAGFDLDPACAFPYTQNQPVTFGLADVRELTGEKLAALYPTGTFRMLAGCAPCQPFSSYTQARDPSATARWGLIEHFGRLVAELAPDFVTMENVPRLAKQQVFLDFVLGLQRRGYHVSFSVVRCERYGIPQLRRRLVLLGSRFGPVSILPPGCPTTALRTLRDALEPANLERLEAGQGSTTDPLHRASGLSPLNLKRIRASVPGGSWRDWADELQAPCHRRAAGRKYVSVYGRLQWDVPAPTITTEFHGFGSGRFGHPEEDRALTPREAALVQTFPREYRFVDAGVPIRVATVARLIGNAVPVQLGWVIGQSILKHARSWGSSSAPEAVRVP